MRAVANLLVLGALAIGTSACAYRPFDRQEQPSLVDPMAYLHVTHRGSTKCYVRIIEGVAEDEICQRGDYVRYSAEPKSRIKDQPVPEYIWALFEAMSESPNE